MKPHEFRQRVFRGFLFLILLLVGLAGSLFLLRTAESSRTAATGSAVVPTVTPQPATASGTPRDADDERRQNAQDMNSDPQKRSHGKPGNLDRRKPSSTRPSEEKLAALEALRRRVPGVDVQFDPITGSPHHVMATGRFLTAAESASDPVNGDFYEPVRRFIGENETLFGHGPDALQGARITREDVAAHNGMRSAVWQQQLDAIPIYNTILRASLTKRGELITIGSHFLSDAEAAAKIPAADRTTLIATPPIDVTNAVSLAAAHLGTKLDPRAAHPASDPAGAERRQRFSAPGLSDTNAGLSWLPMSATSLQLAWDVTLMSLARGEMFRVLVDAKTGEVLMRTSLTNDISNASYRVHAHATNLKPLDSPTPFSPGHNAPSSAQPAEVARNLITLQALDPTASPNGWIDDGGISTFGNNVDAHLDLAGSNPNYGTGIHADSAARVFDFPIDLTQAPSTYQSAAVTTLFYLCNWYHDRLYALGFTESAGNFQQNNFARGGAGSDAVLADAQDGGGFNNANFSTPPDGSPGRMQMFIFSGPTPDRDGDLDAEIVIHEATHGLSNRLVGGGVGISALQPSGMGEGWSDFYAIALLSESGDDANANYAAGSYAAKDFYGLTDNFYYGIRRYPYSTDLTKNPLTLRDIDNTKASPHTGIPRSPIIGNTANEVHNMGEVWCVTLWDARANLVAKYGWTNGNELVLQIVTDGMKLSPTNPTFLQARDAIVQADFVNNGGANRGELWAAFAKRGMGASAIVPASGTTTGVLEAFDLPDPLSVTPATTVTVTGPVGGPFSPASQDYTLRNAGATTLSWTATSSHPWLAISPSGGTLVGGATTTVTFAFTSAAASLTNGLYGASVNFTDVTTGGQLSRTANVIVGGPDYFTELFDASPNDTANQSWLFTPNGSQSFYAVQRTAESAFPTDPAGGTNVSLTDDSNVLATLGSGAQFSFYGLNRSSFYIGSNGYVTFGAGDSSYSADLTSHFAKPRIAALFDDLNPATQGTVSWRQLADRAAVTWQNVPQYGTTDSNNCQIEMFFDGRIRITCLGIASPNGLIGLSTGSGTPANFVESDFSAYGFNIPAIQLGIPATVSEGAGTLTGQGTVSIASAQPSAVQVSLVSSLASKLLVPSTVTIPAGELSAVFNVTIVDDAFISGTQNAIITARASGFTGTARVISVLDNEAPPTFSVAAPPIVSEGAGQVQGTVTLGSATGSTITVALNSSDTSTLQVPSFVAIPAGKTSSTFPITIVNNTKIDGTRNVNITAQVGGWPDATAVIAVLDDENSSLALSVPVQVIEGATSSGTVSIPGTLASALTVSLASNNTGRLAVPSAVTIPAGNTSATFPVTATDNAIADGNASVTISATANGFGAANATASVLDNDAHHFAISAIGSLQIRGVPFGVTITAQDVNGATASSFTGSPSLSASGSIGGVNISPGNANGFTGGTWSANVTAHDFSNGVVLMITDGAGHSGASNAFTVTTGAVDHFAWNPIAGTQPGNVPFGVTITAQDAGNNTVTNFSDAVNLSGGVSVIGTASIAITEINPNTPDEVEFMNISSVPVDVSGWQIFVYDEESVWPAPKQPFIIPAGTICAPGQIFRLQEFGTAPGTFPQFYTGSNINWTSDGGSHVAVLLRDAAGGMVDFAAAASATPSSIFSPSVIPSTQWTGPAIPAPSNRNFTYARTGGSDRNLSADWTTSSAGMGTQNPNLTIPFSGPLAINVSPSISGNFTGGSWTGSVTISQAAIGMKLRAADSTGHIGESNLLDVIIPPPAVSGVSATNVGTTTATFTAVINPNGSPTTAYFQSGTTTSYGTQIPVTLSPSNGFGGQSVSVPFTGLAPGTTYHLRVTATNGGGTTNTTEVTFTTISNDPSLSKLSISPGNITPVFTASNNTYTGSIPSAASSVTVSATTTNANASARARLNGGSFSAVESPFGLASGANTLDVLVTAQDGITTMTYTALIARRTLYEDWAVNSGLSGPGSGLASDFDRDGTVNILEWAFGTNPAVASPGNLVANGGTIVRRGGPTTFSVSNGAGGYTRVAAFSRRMNYVAAGLNYTVQYSSDLASWTSSTAEPNVIAADGEIEIVTVPYPPTGVGGRAVFFHVIVTTP